ncbi:MAG: hypothetical protein KDE55_00985 [Novosphingobium sp.]|nr:hypothetical protein [Novosphingobium sp.]
MERETAISIGDVPHSINGEVLPEREWQLEDDRFLMRADGDHYFFYRKGYGVTIERGAGADPATEPLWCNGSIYAAVASINGFLPIHASAVAINDEVYAFTGPSGAGKSTLATALGQHGLPLFADDTLVLDLSEPDRVIALPGHKRLKLAPDAIALTGARQEEKVGRDIDKFYAVPPGGVVTAPMPLTTLFFLEVGNEPGIVPLGGAEKFFRFQDTHYTAEIYAGAQALGAGGAFDLFARLASQVDMACFVRCRTRSTFDADNELIAEYIKR